jgi:hypothetical protein
MAVQDFILGGIGSDPGSTEYIITLGFGAADSVVSDAGTKIVSGFPVTDAGIVATVVNTGQASAGTFYMNGFAISADYKLQIDTAPVSAGAVWINGIACKTTGVVYVATSGGEASTGGFLLNGSGALIVAENGIPAFWRKGLPFTSSEALCVGSAT